MKQKLALCCALIHKPRLLILDEPTTGIDTVSRREFIGCIKDLNKEFGTTVILSSPYRNELMMCSRIALLEKGRIVSLGNPLDILPRNLCQSMTVLQSKRKTLLKSAA